MYCDTEGDELQSESIMVVFSLCLPVAVLILEAIDDVLSVLLEQMIRWGLHPYVSTCLHRNDPCHLFRYFPRWKLVTSAALAPVSG